MSVVAQDQELTHDQEQIASLLRQVELCCPVDNTGQYDFHQLHGCVQQLESLIFSADLEERVKAVHRCIPADKFPLLNNAYSAWETELEHRFARQIVDGSASLREYHLYGRFDNLIRRELALLQGKTPERLLFIGSGPIPITAIHLHLQAGCPVDCLDRDPSAVAISRRVIDKCGFASSIQVFCGSGEDFDISRYDVILIALLAKPKKRILRNFRKRSRLDARLLCRTSFGLRTVVYEPTVDDDVAGFHIERQQIAEGEQTISTWLLQKAASAAIDVDLRWLHELNRDKAIESLSVMNRVLAKETTIGFPAPLEEATGLSMLGCLDADIKAGRKHVLVAEKAGRIIGQVILTPNSLPNCRHIIELSRGMIDSSLRGGGLTLRAFEEIVSKCEELGKELICLDVREGTTSAALWKHFGFEAFGVLDDYARVGDKRYRGVYMSQTVQSLKQKLGKLTEQATLRSSNQVPS